MAAATLWRNDCQSEPQRYFYNEQDANPGVFDIKDMHYRLNTLSGAVQAVQLRPGYRITLYSEDGWKGVEETIYGAYDDRGQ